MSTENIRMMVLRGRQSRPAPGMGQSPSLAALFVVVLIASSAARAVDCNTNGVDDACEIDCGMSGGPCDLPGCGQAEDCNTNGIPDGCDIVAGALDLNHDGVPDSCVFPLVCERVKPCGNFFLAPNDAADILRNFNRTGQSVSGSSVSVSDVTGPLSCDADGNILVPEWGNARVLVMSPGGSLIRTINGGGLSGPTGSAITPSGEIAICSYLTDSVKFYSATGVYQSNLSHFAGTQDPNSVAFDRAGNLFVGCRNNANPHVAMFNPQLQFVKYIGQGQFSQGCSDIAFDVDENLYVVTAGSIKKFNHEGTLLGTISQSGLNPIGMAIDDTGMLWVTNDGPRDIYRFSGAGQFIDTIPIAFGTNPPTALGLFGIAFDTRGEEDCDTNGTADACDIAGNAALDCNNDGTPDSCQLAGVDCNTNGTLDSCDPDCDADGTPDDCEITGGSPDCNSNGVPDECEVDNAPGYLRFDGTNDFVKVLIDVSETSYSVSLWFRTTNPNGGLFCVKEGTLNNSTGEDRQIFLSNGNLSARVWNQQTISTSGTNFADGQWHHVAHVLGASVNGQRLYVDGVQRAAGDKSSSNFNWQTGIHFGWYSQFAPNYFAGELDEVRVWSATLSATEVIQDFVGANPQSSFLIGRWSFTELSPSQSILDLSGHGHHGSLGADLTATGDDPTRVPLMTHPPFVADCNMNSSLDECDIASSVSDDCNSNGIPDECESPNDCNSNSIQDICEPGGSMDCDGDGITDFCELGSGAPDCDGNQTPDECDAAAGNRALAFDDVDDRVFVPDSPSINPTSFTIEAWVYLNSVQSRNTRLVRKIPGSIGMILAADQDSDQRVQLRVHTPGLVVVKDTQSHSAYVGQWHHVAGVYTANSASLYIDGVLKASTVHANGPLPANTGEMYFGAGLPAADTSEFFGGRLDEIRLWSISRSDSQILADMHKSYSGAVPGLVGYWRFNEGSGQTAGDSSGMGNDGVVGASLNPESSDPQWVETSGETPGPSDCNGNGVPDACDVALGTSQDCNSNSVPDECESDCNGNGFADECDIAGGEPDCNADQVPDSCNIAQGTSTDINTDGIPDDCQADVRVVPIVTILDPSLTTESRNSQPGSLEAVTRGGVYYIELWASDIGETNTGLTGVYTDIEFCNATAANLIEHGAVFTVFPGGTIATGSVDEFGGSALPSGGGIAPEWVRVGWIQMIAAQESSACTIRLAPSTSGIAALNRGSINWAFVGLGSVDLEIVPPARNYDLDTSGFINVGDLSLFAGSWLQTVPPGLSAHDFDCDETVGVGDLSWFATGWLKSANDPTILYPPCGLASPLQRGQSASTDVSVQIAVLTSPSSGDVRTSVPSSVSGFNPGQQYYLEVWVSDIGDINSGITSAYFDLDYHADAFSVLSINHNGVFTLFPSGVAGAGTVDELGGSVLSAGNAVEPLWARLATVRLFANASPPFAFFEARQSETGIAAYGRGVLSWDVVALASVGIGVPVLGDVNADGYVNLQDVEPFSAVLLGVDADPGHQSRSNINQDSFVDGLDIAAFTGLLLAQ